MKYITDKDEKDSQVESEEVVGMDNGTVLAGQQVIEAWNALDKWSLSTSPCCWINISCSCCILCPCALSYQQVISLSPAPLGHKREAVHPLEVYVSFSPACSFSEFFQQGSPT